MKRFVISEDERERILSMHESATKRQYLSEQPAAAPQAQPSQYNQVMTKLTAEMPEKQWMLSNPEFDAKNNNFTKLYNVINKYNLLGKKAPQLTLNGGQDFFNWLKSISPDGNPQTLVAEHIKTVGNFGLAVGLLAKEYLTSGKSYASIDKAVEALKSDNNAKKNAYFASGNDQALAIISNALKGYLG